MIPDHLTFCAVHDCWHAVPPEAEACPECHGLYCPEHRPHPHTGDGESIRPEPAEDRREMAGAR